jgi:hypothetical protein
MPLDKQRDFTARAAGVGLALFAISFIVAGLVGLWGIVR